MKKLYLGIGGILVIAVLGFFFFKPSSFVRLNIDTTKELSAAEMEEIREALRHQIFEGRLQRVESILDSYPNYNIDHSSNLNAGGKSVLQMAVWEDSPELVRLILSYKPRSISRAWDSAKLKYENDCNSEAETASTYCADVEKILVLFRDYSRATEF